MTNNRRGSAMVMILAIAIILNVTLLAFFFATRHTNKASGARRIDVTSLNIAEAGKEHILAQLRNREIRPTPSQTDSVVYSDLPFASGTYSVRYSTNARNDTITIYSTGKTDNDSARIEVIALLTPLTWRNWVKGAVTSPNNVESNGNIEIDGRDHDPTGALLPFGGTFGVSCGGLATIQGSSLMGGGTTPPQPATIEGETVESNIDITGYPTTPEEVLGLPPDALDGFITSGCPTPPISGITYIDEDSHCGDFTGSGVLIIHNDAGDANMGNFYGDFKGLVIADEDKHVNDYSEILGAVILIGRKLGGNVFGNGDARIHYSSIMVEQAIKDAYDIAGKRWAIPVVSWREVK
ncbi:MAG: hypothetical protein JW863_20720 [Chitinispirillaceae bacterium]|nr:hypothetical protein [Chitinispirillaceae bacterium]